jgi:sulfopyruvate decarboxylase TPP-binding subunit
MAGKNEALTRIESHEKLCRIMQKQTHDKIKSIEEQIKRIEKIMIVCAGVLLAGMASVILMLVDKI